MLSRGVRCCGPLPPLHRHFPFFFLFHRSFGSLLLLHLLSVRSVVDSDSLYNHCFIFPLEPLSSKIYHQQLQWSSNYCRLLGELKTHLDRLSITLTFCPGTINNDLLACSQFGPTFLYCDSNYLFLCGADLAVRLRFEPSSPPDRGLIPVLPPYHALLQRARCEHSYPRWPDLRIFDSTPISSFADSLLHSRPPTKGTRVWFRESGTIHLCYLHYSSQSRARCSILDTEADCRLSITQTKTSQQAGRGRRSNCWSRCTLPRSDKIAK